MIEEAGEVIIAAKNDDPKEMISECSDLFYHIFRFDGGEKHFTF